MCIWLFIHRYELERDLKLSIILSFLCLSMFFLFAFHLISLVTLPYVTLITSHILYSPLISSSSVRKLWLLSYQKGSWATNPQGAITLVTDIYLYILPFVKWCCCQRLRLNLDLLVIDSQISCTILFVLCDICIYI